jgi:hypothetical protein
MLAEHRGCKWCDVANIGEVGGYDPMVARGAMVQQGHHQSCRRQARPEGAGCYAGVTEEAPGGAG